MRLNRPLSVPPALSRITLRVRNLLLLIPTDPEVQDALDNFVPKESSVWSHQVDAAPANRKSELSVSLLLVLHCLCLRLLQKTLFQGTGSRSPSLSSKQQHQPSAASILESLFRSSAPGMSTFRVLYNLEVGRECTPTSLVPNPSVNWSDLIFCCSPSAPARC